MLAAVNLDHKSVFEGDEVDDVRADRGLPAELGSAELVGAELLPEALLGLGGRTPQPAGTLNLFTMHGIMMLQIASPHPNPLPQQGEGVE